MLTCTVSATALAQKPKSETPRRPNYATRRACSLASGVCSRPLATSALVHATTGTQEKDWQDHESTLPHSCHAGRHPGGMATSSSSLKAYALGCPLFSPVMS